jgi:hypothetical protein
VAFGHLVAVLAVCAHHPGHADDAAEGEAYDGRVGFPVGGLGVPTTGRRPDVLGVSITNIRDARGVNSSKTHGIFPPPPIVIVYADSWGCCRRKSVRSLLRGRASTDHELGGNSLAVAIITRRAHTTRQLLLLPTPPSSSLPVTSPAY